MQLSLAEELYLVLHYDPAAGELLRKGKVNGSEAHAMAAAKLIGLVDGDHVDVEKARAGETVTAVGRPAANPVLDEARMLLAGQRKPRGVTWCLSNLGGTTAVVERLAALGLLADERRPEAPLTAAGLERLRERRTALDPLVLGTEGDVPGATLIAALLDAGKLWRNVYPGHDRAGQAALAARIARSTAAVAGGGGARRLVVERLGSSTKQA